jgi:hypothetical protein
MLLPFMEHNRKLKKEITDIENKVRRRDILVDDAVPAGFYREKLPGIYDIRTLSKYIKEMGGDRFLRMTKEDFLRYNPDEEEIIELTDVVDDPEIQESDIIIKDLDDDTEIDNFQKDDFAASLGLKIDDGIVISGDISETVDLDSGQEKSEIISVSAKQLEEAIERVVRKMLGEKIDGILYKVIERAVSQEIIRLKNILHVNEEEDID